MFTRSCKNTRSSGPLHYRDNCQQGDRGGKRPQSSWQRLPFTSGAASTGSLTPKWWRLEARIGRSAAGSCSCDKECKAKLFKSIYPKPLSVTRAGELGSKWLAELGIGAQIWPDRREIGRCRDPEGNPHGQQRWRLRGKESLRPTGDVTSHAVRPMAFISRDHYTQCRPHTAS